MKLLLLSSILLISPLSTWAADAYAATIGNTYTSRPATQDSVIEGTVVNVDSVYRRVTVKDDAGNLTEFSLSPNTPVTGSYDQKNFRDLHPGDRIAVAYTDQQIQGWNDADV
jgi:hypothetical protein